MKQTDNQIRYHEAIALLESSLMEDLHRAKEAIAVERSADEVDMRVGLDARDMDTMRLMRTSRRLEEVRAARRRLRNGSYGVCETCEEQIPPKRLEAVPWAAYCVTCQEMRDQQITAPQGLEDEHGMVEVR